MKQFNKMLFHPSKSFKFDLIWKIVLICSIFITPAHLFPRPENVQLKNQSEASTIPITLKPITDLETLNSKSISVNVQNDVEKPVLNSTAASNIESENSVTNASNGSKSSRQLTIPFMAVPTNWVATFEPSNAVILTQNMPLRIWAIGSVSKFPSFLERFIQRVQSYYSTYKYHDLSRPASLAIINPQYHLQDTSGNTQIESIDHDLVEEDTELPNIDYYDTTTDINGGNDDNDDDNDDDDDDSDDDDIDETTESYTNYQSDETATTYYN